MDEKNEDLTPSENMEESCESCGCQDVSGETSSMSSNEEVSIAANSPQASGTQGEQMEETQMPEASSQVQELSQKADEALNKTTAVVNKAAEEVQKATHDVGDFITESSTQVAETLTNVSQCLHKTAQDMTQHEHPVFGRYVRSAAETMERFSDSLRHKDLDFFVDRTEELARHQPGIFLGSAFTVGFAIGRYLKGKSSDITESIRQKTHEVVQSAGISTSDQEHEDTSGTWH